MSFTLKVTLFIIFLLGISLIQLTDVYGNNNTAVENHQVFVQNNKTIEPPHIGGGNTLVRAIDSPTLNPPNNNTNNICNCVIFRLDDVQDYWLSDIQITVMDQFILKNKPLAVGPILNNIGNDSTVIDKVNSGYRAGLFEIFIHGWDHVDYSQLSLQNQTSTLQQAKNKTISLFGVTPKIFVPPYDAFNADTLTAMNKTGLNIISAANWGDPYPNFIANGTKPQITDGLGIFHMPSSTGFVNFGDNDSSARVSDTQILTDVNSSISIRGYAVITLHAQDLRQKLNGVPIDVLNQTDINDLDSLIDSLTSKHISITTFGNATEFRASVPIRLSITSPINNTVTGTPTVSASGSAIANGNSSTISSVKWKVDSATIATNATGTTSWSFTTGSLSEGIHTIQVNATNTVGNITSKKIVVKVDTTKPILVINSPDNNTITDIPIVDVSGTAFDNNTTVESVKWKVDNDTSASNAIGTTSWSFTTGSLSNGTHTIEVNATDTAGNIASKHLGITITGPSTITGTVYNDTNNDGIQNSQESGIAGARVIAVDLANPGTILQTTTDANGTYLFENLTASHIFLIQNAPVPRLHLPSTGHHSYNYVTSSVGENTIDFPLFPITGSNLATISGKVFEDANNNGVQDLGEKGLNNTQVFVVDFLTLSQRTVHTDSNGHYTATGILPDNVLVQVAPVPSRHLPSTSHHSFVYPPSLVLGSSNTVNFPLRPVSLSELMTIHVRVFNDTNGNGIQDNGEKGLPGVQVFSFGLLTAEQQNLFTDLTGTITFSGITPDVTLVQEATPTGLVPTSPVGTLGFRYFDFTTVSSGANLAESFGLH